MEEECAECLRTVAEKMRWARRGLAAAGDAAAATPWLDLLTSAAHAAAALKKVL